MWWPVAAAARSAKVSILAQPGSVAVLRTVPAVIAVPGVEPVALAPDADFARLICSSRLIAVAGRRCRRFRGAGRGFGVVPAIGLVPGAVVPEPCAIAASFVAAMACGPARIIYRATHRSIVVIAVKRGIVRQAS